MKKVTRIVCIPIVGLLVILGACTPPITTPPMPPGAQAPASATPTPVTAAPGTPVPVTGAPATPAPVTAAPVTATPAPVTATPAAPAVDAAGFVVSNLQVSPDQAGPGEQVTVVFDLKNPGAQPGTDSLAVNIDGVQAATQNVTLAAGSDQTVNIAITVPPVGSHTVSVDGQTVKLTSYVF